MLFQHIFYFSNGFFNFYYLNLHFYRWYNMQILKPLFSDCRAWNGASAEKKDRVKCLFLSKPLTKILQEGRFSYEHNLQKKNDLSAVFWSKVLIGISFSNNLFFQQMRQLKPYNYKITVLKFSYDKHYKYANFIKNGCC